MAPLIGWPASSLTDAADAAGLRGGARCQRGDQDRGEHAADQIEDDDACESPCFDWLKNRGSRQGCLAASSAGLNRPALTGARFTRQRALK